MTKYKGEIWSAKDKKQYSFFLTFMWSPEIEFAREYVLSMYGYGAKVLSIEKVK